MYVWIWRHLPGTLSWKLLQTFVLVLIVANLFLWVIFPLVEPHLGLNDPAIGGGASGGQ
jgi:hypothetical protein